MISWLFGTDSLIDMLATPTFWYTIVLLIGLIVGIVSCFKYPKVGKWVILGVVAVGYVIITVYSITQLNGYYSAKGGIYGQISGLFDTNQVKVVDEVTFEFTNIELTLNNGTTYSADITTDEVLKIENKEYGVFVNDMPCYYVENADDYVLAKYSYSFLDNDMSVLCTDTLTLRFALYENSTYLSVSTDGGSTAVKYWNYYFNKNAFTVTLAERDYIYSNDINYGAGDTSNYCTATYIVDGEIYLTAVYTKGLKPNYPTFSDRNLIGWAIDGIMVDSEFVLTEDTTLTAIFTEIVEIFVSKDEFKVATDFDNNYDGYYVPTSFADAEEPYYFILDLSEYINYNVLSVSVDGVDDNIVSTYWSGPYEFSGEVSCIATGLTKSDDGKRTWFHLYVGENVFYLFLECWSANLSVQVEFI